VRAARVATAPSTRGSPGTTARAPGRCVMCEVQCVARGACDTRPPPPTHTHTLTTLNVLPCVYRRTAHFTAPHTRWRATWLTTAAASPTRPSRVQGTCEGGCCAALDARGMCCVPPLCALLQAARASPCTHTHTLHNTKKCTNTRGPPQGASDQPA
jgi:hypothetical protein